MRRPRANGGAAIPPRQIFTALSPEERDELAESEQVIERGFRTFFEVGEALLRIKSKRLYRAEFATFEDYCRTKLEISRAHAYRLVNAAEVCVILPNGNSPRPIQEAQVRPLTMIPRDKVAAVWERAVRIAGKNRVSAEVVRKAAAEFSVRDSASATERRHWQEVCLRRLKRICGFVTKAEAEKALRMTAPMTPNAPKLTHAAQKHKKTRTLSANRATLRRVGSSAPC